MALQFAPMLMGISAAFQGISAMKNANAQSRASQIEAQRAEQNAELVLQQTREDERVFRVSARKQLGEMRANVGASGLQFSGSIADVIGESAAAMELDALKLRHSGALKAYGLRTDAALLRGRAAGYAESGPMSAAGYLLGGASDIAKNYGGSSSKTDYSYDSGSSGGFGLQQVYN